MKKFEHGIMRSIKSNLYDQLTFAQTNVRKRKRDNAVKFKSQQKKLHDHLQR